MRRRNFLELFFVLFSFIIFFDASFVRSDDEISLREGFMNPPSGYGEIPFWWWTGERLDVERLKWQIDELARKGVSGVQVNYAHQDIRNAVQPNWLTYPNEPEVLSDEWFETFSQVAAHCLKYGMGIGLSGYTLDWQNSPGNLFDRLIYRDRETQSQTLYVASKKLVVAGTRYSDVFVDSDFVSNESDAFVQLVAYPKTAMGKLLTAERVLLDVEKLDASRAEVDMEIWTYRAKREPHTLNPLHPESGRKVVDRFFQPFATRALSTLGGADDGKSNLGLNYFFQDELQLGTGEMVWFDDVAHEFFARKGYDYWTAVPAMFGADVGSFAEKYRLDYMDVRVKLAEERYFIPIYRWHAERDRIYACDSSGRGKDPSEFCDYFSAARWYTAPGHDTPGGRADFIKNKVSSSIAHFYDRPRVWLEGYHSFGWGAEPKRLLFATNENFLFGANLLNLHGLYYTTYGGYWEWAPPCYHFRMPYWETFGTFLKYFERLSFALTRGVEQTDIVVLYPVSSYHAKLDPERARDVAFEGASVIYQTGRDVLFIDDESIQRAEIRDGRLCVSGGAHRALVLPSLQGVRWETLKQALALYRSGGMVIALDQVPIASDRAGRNDPELDAAVRELFGVCSNEPKGCSISRNAKGGVGALITTYKESKQSDDLIVDGVVSKLREYPGGFQGRWAWAKELKKDVYLKWVVKGLGTIPKELSARFFCDNSGTLYVNGRSICSEVDYSVGWEGRLTLRDGDVLTIDARDADEPRQGSAGFFFALNDGDQTIASAEDFRYALVPFDDARRKSDKDFETLLPVNLANVHVLHRTGVNTERGDVPPAPSVFQDDALMWNALKELISEIPVDVVDAETFAPCLSMKRATSDADIYFVMKGKKNAKLAFRSQGRAEFYNAWDGTSREPVATIIPTTGRFAGRTIVSWPYGEDEAGLIVFWKHEEPSNPVADLELNGSELELLTVDEQGERRACAVGVKETHSIRLVESDGTERALTGRSVSSASTLTLDGDWTFELLPTLNNRWGDFRLPISEETLGAEAQRVDVEGAGNYLNDFGRKFWKLGPFPRDVDLSKLENELSQKRFVDPKEKIEFNGKSYVWEPYSFSWRWGVEGAPGRQGYHGLKERVDSRFIALGVAGEGFNETSFKPEESGDVYFLWSTIDARVVSSKDLADYVPVDVYVSGGAPSAIYVGGVRFESERLYLGSSKTDADRRSLPVLLRYDGSGRYACGFVRRQKDACSASRLIEMDGQDSGAFNGLSSGLREETPDAIDFRAPLSTIWFNMPGVLEYDLFGVGANSSSEFDGDFATQRFSFIAPPGLKELSIPSYGRVSGFSIDGVDVEVKSTERIIRGRDFWRGVREGRDTIEAFANEYLSQERAPIDRAVFWTTLELVNPIVRASRISLTLSELGRGRYDGGAFPEPIRLRCEAGLTSLGDWNALGALENYSGGARYSKRFLWSGETGEKGRITLDLGAVGVSCRVFLNGELVGDLPTPPWTFDFSERLLRGENLLEIEVYSALSNFYKNIPSRYKDVVPSGLIGPVRIIFEPRVELTEKKNE